MAIGMEDWQKEVINENLPELITCIKCDVLLLAYLVKYGAMSQTEMDNLNSIQGGEVNKASALMRILPERVGAYGHLAKALLECRQSGAFSILLKGIQQKLILRDVYFGCLSLPLQNICKVIEPKSLQNIIASEVNEDTYEQFLNPEPWTLETETVPKSLAYYIPRTLSISNEIDPKIFTKLTSDIFCIEGLELYQLSSLASRTGIHYSTNSKLCNPPDYSRNQIKGITTRFILLERRDHFPDIAEKSVKPVHWLQYSQGKYWYVKSNPGSEVKNVSKFLLSNGVKHLNEKEFIERCVKIPGNEPVFIYDSPGMGKSVLLAELARKMKERRPEGTVVHFEISDLIQKVRQCGDSCSVAAVKQTIVESVGVNELGRKILRKLLDSRAHQIKLFLDGYDEVLQSDSSDAYRILETLVKEGDNIRIFVATRPHKKTELEEKFGALGYNLLPFDDSNKLSFFLKYWKSKHGVDITDGTEKFAKHCLNTLRFKMSGGEGDIAGIPLQCRMLADIYADDAKKGGLIPTESQFQLNSIFQVYKLFIGTKFSKFYSDDEKENYYNFHLREALRTLFPDAYNHFHDETPSFDLIYRIGILEPLKSDSSKPTFSHRTLAEYFAAEFLATSAVSKLAMNFTESEFFIKLFFRQALMWNFRRFGLRLDRIFENLIVCRFLNFFLSTLNSDAQDFGPVKNALRKSNLYNSQTLIGLLDCCLTIDAVHLYLYLLKVYLDLDELRDNPTSLLRFNQDLPDTENWKQAKKIELLRCLKKVAHFCDMVATAAEHSSLNLVKLSCDFLESVTGNKVHQFQYYHGPMQSALQRGHYQIFEYLLSFDKEQCYKMPLLHWCLEDRWRFYK